MKKKYYAYIIPEAHKSGITDNWPACERAVKGKRGARFRGFGTRDQARAWLESGATYKDREAIKASLPRAIYFDAGTGRGLGLVEINVTDESGLPLLWQALPKKDITVQGTHVIRKKSASNNFGELLACKYALEIAMKRRVPLVCGDSVLIINYWSRGLVTSKNVSRDTVALAGEVQKLRNKFEKKGGKLQRVSGDINPADLGFHR